MFKAQMFQKNHSLFILTQKPAEPLNLQKSRIREGDFLLHVAPEASKKILYQVQSNQLVPKGNLQDADLVEAAESSVKNGAKYFKQALWNQTTNTPLISCATITPRCFLDINPAELKTLIIACRLPRIVEELDELAELDCKLPREETSPLTISHQHSPMYQEHEQHNDADSASAAYRV